jgi:hypothetical protein
MSPEATMQLASLSDLTTDQLIKKYETLSGEKCRSRNRRYVYRRVAWMVQAKHEGGLSERALLRAGVIAGESLVRVTAPRTKAKSEVESTVPDDWDQRIPPPGNLIERRYKGRTLRILVLSDGFEYEGERYKSLTAIARVITGSHCNGFLFFKLGQPK